MDMRNNTTFMRCDLLRDYDAFAEYFAERLADYEEMSPSGQLDGWTATDTKVGRHR